MIDQIVLLNQFGQRRPDVGHIVFLLVGEPVEDGHGAVHRSLKLLFRYVETLGCVRQQHLIAQELVTELYLADTEQKQNRLWIRVHKAMIKLKIKPNIIEHIMKTRSTMVLAKNLEDWLKASS